MYTRVELYRLTLPLKNHIRDFSSIPGPQCIEVCFQCIQCSYWLSSPKHIGNIWLSTPSRKSTCNWNGIECNETVNRLSDLCKRHQDFARYWAHWPSLHLVVRIVSMFHAFMRKNIYIQPELKWLSPTVCKKVKIQNITEKFSGKSKKKHKEILKPTPLYHIDNFHHHHFHCKARHHQQIITIAAMLPLSIIAVWSQICWK